MFKRFLLTSAIALASTAAHAESTLVFTGASFTEDSYYTYLGGVTALNHDLGKDGFLVRASGAWGEYSYDRTGTTSVDGDVGAGDLMVGYQHFFAAANAFKGGRVTLYVGGDYQNHDLNTVDTLNPVRGSEGGLKGQADLSLNLIDKVSLDLNGSYSGAFNTYWSKAQLGYDINGIKVGPEASFLGSESYDQQRYGAFVKGIDLGVAKLGGSAGYADSIRRGNDGAYGEVGLSFTF
ncbi:MAG: cellulose biosynthesis protein BcsS [Alphaproteobacteria bacterium]|nr:cellulose biosynthesis protein BcsS [Alphaproteobacteria bacterium]